MASAEFVATPKPHPDLKIPASNNICTVRVIDSTAHGRGPAKLILSPHIPGHDNLEFPCFSFLISNAAKDTHILFDIGIRKDYWNLAPVVAARITGDEPLFEVHVAQNVSEILDSHSATGAGGGITSRDISAVIWSHHHWDHIGDMTTFPPGTSLILGPGFQKEYLPGYPTNPDSALLDADFTGRQVRELPLSAFDDLTLGRFGAHDYFGDGSLYLLHSPGHTVGHMCALARTTPTTFVLLGGDACHHGGEFRPTEYLPLPTDVPAAPRSRFGGCPGAFLVEKIHPRRDGTVPFYDIARGFSHDHDEAKRSIAKLQEFDASEDVLVCIAHDRTMLGSGLDFYPDAMNGWKEKGVQKEIRWAFIGDFDLEAERPPQPEAGEEDADYSWLSKSASTKPAA